MNKIRILSYDEEKKLSLEERKAYIEELSKNILSYSEEANLSADQRKEYYKKLREFLKDSPQKTTRKLHLLFAEILNKTLIRPVINNIKGYELEITGRENIPVGIPVVYASTHQDYNDHFSAVLSIPEHVEILNTNTVTPNFKFLMWFNGIVYVDRNQDWSRFGSKLSLMEDITKGKSILMFPEGTYNCSPNQLILPIHSGVFDIARKTGAPVIPMVQEYTYDDEEVDYKKRVQYCHVQFGKPIYVKEDDNIEEKKQEYLEQVSTIRYNLREKKGILKRSELSERAYYNYLQSRKDTWESIDVKIDDERKTIYGYNEQDNKYKYINDAEVDEEGKILQPEMLRVPNTSLNKKHI